MFPSTNERSKLIDQILVSAIRVMEAFPSLESQRALLSDIKPQNDLHPVYVLLDHSPKRTFPVFVDTSSVLAMLIAQFAGKFPRKVWDSDLSSFSGSRLGVKGWQDTGALSGIPFSEVVTVLLGRDAPRLLFKSSRDGRAKLQPHEYSRGGLYLLKQFLSQLRIEDELIRLDELDRDISKDVVTLLWILTAMAMHMDGSVFIHEGSHHISAVTDTSITMSNGKGTETLVHYWPSSMMQVVRTLQMARNDPELGAPDLMWIAAGQSRIMSHTAILGPDEHPDDDWEVFFSHRGPDTKAALVELVRGHLRDRSAFVDCLVMPKGFINRHFLFRSLVRSRQVVVVKSARFDESTWCRKERAAANVLACLDYARVITVDSIPAAMACVDSSAELDTGSPPVPPAEKDKSEPGWVCRRILQDINNWARTPNLHGARKKGLPVDAVKVMLDWLGKRLRALPRKGDPTAPIRIRNIDLHPILSPSGLQV